jgi:hypothetical protein
LCTSKSSWPLPQKDENVLCQWLEDETERIVSQLCCIEGEIHAMIESQRRVCRWKGQFPCSKRAVKPREREQNRRIRVCRLCGWR